MKVGIATVHDSSNLGSYLQALGMQELVRQHGDEPYIIRTRSEFTTLCLFLGYNNAPPVRSVKLMVKFILFMLCHPRIIAERYKKYKAYKSDRKGFKQVISVKQANNMRLDALLLGSDEIWNSNQPAFQNPLLYGNGINAEKKFGYAVSVGNMDEDNFNKYLNLLKAIAELDGILARDKRTEDILKNKGININSAICDPTLQVDIKGYMKDEREVCYPKGKYIVIYSYHIEKHMQEVIKRFAEKRGLKTVAVSLYQDWCDEYLNCSPLEFGAVLKNAEFVFTSTFHGTIFSILYYTKFAAVASVPKVDEVLRLLELEGAAVKSDCTESEFEKVITEKKDYKAVDERLAVLKKESRDLYKKYIQGV